MRSCKQCGFTYLGLIILVTIIGLAATAALQVGAVVERRQAESELLYIGTEFEAALADYARVTPAGQSTLPGTLNDLLYDPRFPDIHRHLRKIYVDPMTGNDNWGIVTGSGPGGTGIVGIYSLSDAKPIQISNFEPQFTNFRRAKTYQDWVFSNYEAGVPTADGHGAVMQ